MGVDDGEHGEDFGSFLARVEPRLRRALVASYGPVVGRDATVDALSWAWEHFDRLRPMENAAGYLYRVGQTAANRHRSPQRPSGYPAAPPDEAPEVTPELAVALARLSVQQRAAVMLVHGYALSQRDAADALGLSVSTIREHLERGLGRLRRELELHHER